MTLDFLRFSHYYCFFPPSLQENTGTRTRGQVPVSHENNGFAVWQAHLFGSWGVKNDV